MGAGAWQWREMHKRVDGDEGGGTISTGFWRGYMKVVGIIGSAVLMAAGIGAAHAQAASCTEIPQMMAYSHAQVRALQGGEIEQDADDITYTSKKQVGGFTTCRLSSNKAIDTISDYWEHHLWCEGQSANAEAANQVMESAWACLKAGFSEREASEAFMGGRYRVVGFSGEVPTAGLSAGLVDFGDTDYARVVLEKSYDASDDYDLHVYWMFKQ